MRGVACAAVALLLLTVLAAPSDAAVTYTALGIDPEGDDANLASGSPSSSLPTPVTVPCPQANDCSNIDDILAVGVATVGTRLDFKLTVRERPEKSALAEGEYCWLVGFQVKGEVTERIGMGCMDYTNGQGSVDNSHTTSRGANIASGFGWDATEAAVVIRIPLKEFGGQPGTTLVDIYGLTYIGENLQVDDAAPNGKADRNAVDSYGTYVVEGTIPPPPPVVKYAELDGKTIRETADFQQPLTGSTTYNWTTDLADVRIGFSGFVANGTVSLLVRDAGNQTVFEGKLASPGNVTKDARAATPGRWQVVLSYVDFRGNTTFTLEGLPKPPSASSSSSTTTQPSSSSSTSHAAPVTSTSAQAAQKSPLPLPIVVAALGLVAWAGRRRMR